MEKQLYDPQLFEYQKKMGCAVCRYADDTRLGYNMDFCRHAEGFLPSAYSLHCINQALKFQLLFNDERKD